MTNDVRVVSATRSGDGWTRPCAHAHPDVAGADRCAEKRGADVLVVDPDERGSKPAIVPAPYLVARRKARRGARPVHGGRRRPRLVLVKSPIQ